MQHIKNIMAMFSRAKKPSQARQLETEAEAGPGAMSQVNSQTISTADAEKEKAMNGASDHSPSDSSEAIAENSKPSEPPADEEKKRSTAKNILLVIALCVCTI